MLENISNILYICIAVVSICISIATLIIGRIRKLKTNAEKRISDEEYDELEERLTEAEDTKSQLGDSQNMLKIFGIVQQAIRVAEQQPNLTGSAKKLIAVSDVIQRMAMEGIDYGKYAREVDKTIEEQVAFTKEVNSK